MAIKPAIHDPCCTQNQSITIYYEKKDFYYDKPLISRLTIRFALTVPG